MLHRDVFGKGPAVVLLHGWASNRRVFGDLARHLASHYQVHRIDLPGHGASAGTESALTAQAVARQVQAVTPDDAVWVGWSLGGLVALATACQIPIRALVLVAAPPRFVGGAPATVPETVRETSGRLQADYPAALWDYLAMQVAARDRAALAALHRVQVAEPPSRQGIAAGARILLETDLADAASRISVPTLLVTGSQDPLLPSPAASTGCWPRLGHRGIDGAAHAPFLSHPDTFVQALEPFLARVTAGGARSAGGHVTHGVKLMRLSGA